MSKFKVGDRVKVREWDDMVKEFGVDSAGDIRCRCCFTRSMRKYCGEIKTVISVNGGCYILAGCRERYYAWNFTDDMLEAVTNDQKIIVTTDGVKVVTAKLMDGKKTIKEAVAKCCPTDEFDFETGAAIAFDRLLGYEPLETVKESEPVKHNPTVGEQIEVFTDIVKLLEKLNDLGLVK